MIKTSYSTHIFEMVVVVMGGGVSYLIPPSMHILIYVEHVRIICVDVFLEPCETISNIRNRIIIKKNV